MKAKQCSCGGDAPLNRHCGAYICDDCDKHIGLSRCYCGWSETGGDGYLELIDDGETIEPEE